MKKRPLSLKFVALFYLLIGLSLPLQVAFLFEHGPSEWAQILSKMTLINWVLGALAILTASFIWMGHRFVKYFIPLTILVVILNNWVVSSYGEYYSETETLMASLAFTLFNCVLLFGRGYEAIIYPDMQWWRVSPRLRTNERVLLALDGGEVLEAALFDISKSGLFIGQDHALQAQMLRPGDEVTIGLPRQGKAPLIIAAKIVRRDLARGHYPSGFGLCFEKLGLFKKLQLSLFMRQLASATSTAAL